MSRQADPDSPASAPLPSPALELHASLSLGTDSRHWGNQRRMALLRAIDEEGSISAGARKIGLSYKAAWDAVDAMNTLAGEDLVERSAGGHRGGGARLTPRAHALLELYLSLDQAHERFLGQLAALAREAAPDLDLIRHLMASDTAQNKLRGVVTHILPGGVIPGVVVRIDEATEIVVQPGARASRELDLRPGRSVLLFIDAAAIVIGLAGSTEQLSARNQIEGKVSHIHQDTHGNHISISLPGGQTLISLITPKSIKSLDLQPGSEVRAIFKASAVTLGRDTHADSSEGAQT